MENKEKIILIKQVINKTYLTYDEKIEDIEIILIPLEEGYNNERCI